MWAQSDGGCARTASLIGVFNSIGGNIPRNAGSFRRVEVLSAHGSVAGIPEHPTSCSVSTTNLADRVTHAVSLAMAELGDGYGMAECGGCLPPSSSVISGVDPRTGERFVNQMFLGSTAGPATPYGDCWLTYLHIGNGGMCFIDSVELDELVSADLGHRAPPVAGHGGCRSPPRRFQPARRVRAGRCAVEVGYVSDGSVNAARGAPRRRRGRPGRTPQASTRAERSNRWQIA